jgi:hypothetical protein
LYRYRTGARIVPQREHGGESGQRKLAAEFVGTALLVIFAVGAATLSFGL